MKSTRYHIVPDPEDGERWLITFEHNHEKFLMRFDSFIIPSEEEIDEILSRDDARDQIVPLDFKITFVTLPEQEAPDPESDPVLKDRLAFIMNDLANKIMLAGNRQKNVN